MTTEYVLNEALSAKDILSRLGNGQTVNGYTRSELEVLRALPDLPEAAITDLQLFERLYPGENPNDTVGKGPKLKRAQVRRRRAGEIDGYEIVNVSEDGIPLRFIKRWETDSAPSPLLIKVIYGDQTDEQRKEMSPQFSNLSSTYIDTETKPKSLKQKFQDFLLFLDQPAREVKIHKAEEKQEYKDSLQVIRRRFASTILAHLRFDGLKSAPENLLDFFDKSLSEGASEPLYKYMNPEVLEKEVMRLACLGIRNYWIESEIVKTQTLAHAACLQFKNKGYQLDNIYQHLFLRFKQERFF